MTALHICRTPMKVIDTRDAGDRWCFVCRKRVPFTDECWATIEPSYYDPQWQRRCPRGHIDGDLFPGYSREWSS